MSEAGEEYTLRVETAEGSVSTVPLSRLPFGIGRDQDNDLVLDDLLVSRHHAFLRRTPDGLAVVDNRSRNGIHLNGKKITGPQLVRPGDTIGIGGTKIRFE